MAKNKGTHGRGKVDPELTEPDEFVQRVNSLSDTLQPHLKKIAIGIGIVTAGIIAWQVKGWMHDKAAKKSTESYVATMKVLDRPVVGPDDVAPVTSVPVEPFVTEEAKRNAALQALEDLSGEDMPMASLALPRKAKLLLESGKFDEAAAAYTKVTKSSVPAALRLAAKEGIGYSLEGKAMASKDPDTRQNGLSEALKAFSSLQPNEGSPMYDYSLYHQGRILVAMGKRDEGIVKFKLALDKTSDPSLQFNVETRLDVLGAGE